MEDEAQQARKTSCSKPWAKQFNLSRCLSALQMSISLCLHISSLSSGACIAFATTAAAFVNRLKRKNFSSGSSNVVNMVSGASIAYGCCTASVTDAAPTFGQ
ncbi:unnamed protein product [Polarella glacialis]|uniref:Uncharacterized protein n=1 Tax=Polarella glacialis TaxID=89957 RepID=A0A813I3Z0_POLGL|nr:unnamed protein product [Polarella glacialis]